MSKNGGNFIIKLGRGGVIEVGRSVRVYRVRLVTIVITLHWSYIVDFYFFLRSLLARYLQCTQNAVIVIAWYSVGYQVSATTVVSNCSSSKPFPQLF